MQKHKKCIFNIKIWELESSEGGCIVNTRRFLVVEISRYLNSHLQLYFHFSLHFQLCPRSLCIWQRDLLGRLPGWCAEVLYLYTNQTFVFLFVFVYSVEYLARALGGQVGVQRTWEADPLGRSDPSQQDELMIVMMDIMAMCTIMTAFKMMMMRAVL